MFDGNRSKYRLLWLKRSERQWIVEHMSDACKQSLQDAQDRAKEIIRLEGATEVEITKVVEVVFLAPVRVKK